jgi:hypothetical protein
MDVMINNFIKITTLNILSSIIEDTINNYYLLKSYGKYFVRPLNDYSCNILNNNIKKKKYFILIRFRTKQQNSTYSYNVDCLANTYLIICFHNNQKKL